MAFFRLPEGIYEGLVRDWDFIKVGKKGTPALGVRVKVTHMVRETEDGEGRTVEVLTPLQQVFEEEYTDPVDPTTGEPWDDGEASPVPAFVYRNVNLWLNSDTNIDRTLSTLRKCLNFNGELDQLDPSHPEGANFYGKKVRIKVKHGEWNGQPREEIEFIRSRDAIPLADKLGILEAIKARAAKRAKEEAAAADAARQAEEEAAAALAALGPEGDDDVPF